MKLRKGKYAAVAKKAKRRLENPLTKAQKAEKAAVDEVERQRKIQRTADRNSERARAEAERRSDAGVEGLAAEVIRKSAIRKINPLTVEQKAKKTVASKCNSLSTN